MTLDIYINAILLGIGLAMDAFSVSVVSGLSDPHMKAKRSNTIAGTFAGFQFLMPVVGYVVVRFLITIFKVFEQYIPIVSLLVLSYIGIKMIISGFSSKEEVEPITNGTLLLMGVATSIDALSAGFTFAEYTISDALISAGIILLLTYAICMVGIYLGRKIGDKLSKKAPILGGIILIAIGLEIFAKSFV